MAETATCEGFWLACAVCGLSGGPYPSQAETAHLVGVHDRLHHGGRPTATVAALSGCESCRQVPATLTWSHPGAGAPFALCPRCTPTDALGGGER